MDQPLTFSIAVFASGNGSNAENIIKYFRKNPGPASVSLVLCNKPQAYVLERAYKLGVETIVADKAQFEDQEYMLGMLRERNIELLVLAGFLWLLPEYLVRAYPHRIINIHPALLPKYGGKGMYGMKVHETVLAAGEKETGISIHYVDSKYDEGEIIFSKSCPVDVETQNADDIAENVHKLEYEYYPMIIEREVKKILQGK